MNGGNVCLMEEPGSDSRSTDGCRRLRLRLQEHKQPPGGKPIGRAFALVQPANDRTAALVQPANERTALTAQPVKQPTKEKVEVIKVFLEASRKEQYRHQQSLKMLSDEVTHIQEVRFSLKTLREKMAAKNKGVAGAQRIKHTPGPDRSKMDTQEVEAEAERLREVSKRLYAQLQDTEKTHLEERERLQAEGNALRQRLSDQEEVLRSSEEQSGRRAQRLEELHRLLGGMEQESAALQDTVRQREDELRDLRRSTEEGHTPRRSTEEGHTPRRSTEEGHTPRRSTEEGHTQAEQRAEQLEQEVAILKEKLHHLDDMLKSQQRKVRHMIEQLQNSRTVIQERERVIRELEEKVAFLVAENRQMHDQMDYFLEGQRSNSYLSSELNPHIVYSKPLKPSTSSSNKPLPFIKVIEMTS